jgi:hypothetical protein
VLGLGALAIMTSVRVKREKGAVVWMELFMGYGQSVVMLAFGRFRRPK